MRIKRLRDLSSSHERYVKIVHWPRKSVIFFPYFGKALFRFDSALRAYSPKAVSPRKFALIFHTFERVLYTDSD